MSCLHAHAQDISTVYTPPPPISDFSRTEELQEQLGDRISWDTPQDHTLASPGQLHSGESWVLPCIITQSIEFIVSVAFLGSPILCVFMPRLLLIPVIICYCVCPPQW